jgi:Tfp pilus assembly protein PilF
LASTTISIKLTILAIMAAVFLSACTTPKPVVRTDDYHQPEKMEKNAKALNGLQLKALQLMNQQQFENAILYLQRAIKVEPRNPLNWHYLAQNYWHLKDYGNCRAMIKRAISYSQFDPDLMRANHALLNQCSP